MPWSGPSVSAHVQAHERIRLKPSRAPIARSEPKLRRDSQIKSEQISDLQNLAKPTAQCEYVAPKLRTCPKQSHQWCCSAVARHQYLLVARWRVGAVPGRPPGRRAARRQQRRQRRRKQHAAGSANGMCTWQLWCARSQQQHAAGNAATVQGSHGLQWWHACHGCWPREGEQEVLKAQVGAALVGCVHAVPSLGGLCGRG